MIEKLKTYPVEVIETGEIRPEATQIDLTAKVLEIIEVVNRLEKPTCEHDWKPSTTSMGIRYCEKCSERQLT